MSETKKIILVSGGTGASGEGIIHTVLAQYPVTDIPVVKISNVRHIGQLRAAIEQALASQGLIVHTLVDPDLHAAMVDLTAQAEVPSIDLMGPLIDWIGQALGVKPAGQPGLYRRLHRDYFERIDAIEYTMAHDDGKRPDGWKDADVVITGPSRTGKTPISLYLSVLGYKVANVPIVAGVQPQPQFFALDPKRVVGLTIEPGALILQRQKRQERLGVTGPSAYVNPEQIYEEVQTTRKLFRRAGFKILDVTDKPVETSADEIIRVLTASVV